MSKIPLSCNLRFNVKNERHMKAAELLSMVGSRYKTAFVALAVEAYINTHPSGIDINELREVQRDTWHNEKEPSDGNTKKIIKDACKISEAALPVVNDSEPDKNGEAVKTAMNFYNI